MMIMKVAREILQENIRLAAQAVGPDEPERVKEEDKNHDTIDPLPLFAGVKKAVSNLFKRAATALSFRGKEKKEQDESEFTQTSVLSLMDEVEVAFSPVINALNQEYSDQEKGRRFRLVTFLEEGFSESGLEIKAYVGHFTDKEEEAFRWLKNEGQGYSPEHELKWADVESRTYKVIIPLEKCVEGLFFESRIGHRIKDKPENRLALEPLPENYTLGDYFKTYDMGMVLRGIFEKFKLEEHTLLNHWSDFEDAVREQTLNRNDINNATIHKLRKGQEHSL